MKSIAVLVLLTSLLIVLVLTFGDVHSSCELQAVAGGSAFCTVEGK